MKESGNDKTALLCGGERKVETGVEERGGEEMALKDVVMDGRVVCRATEMVI